MPIWSILEDKLQKKKEIEENKKECGYSPTANIAGLLSVNLFVLDLWLTNQSHRDKVQ